MQYTITITIDVGNAVDSVGAVLKRINDSLATVGIDEKLRVQTSISVGTLTCSRKLQQKEVEHVNKILTDQFAGISSHIVSTELRSTLGQSSSKSL